MKLALAEEQFLMQISRVKWIEAGDCNSAYFHKMVASRRASNQIHYPIENSGHIIDSPQEVQSHCVNFFSYLFGENSGIAQEIDANGEEFILEFKPYRCDASSQALLLAPFSTEEIKREVFALPANKSSGPDGFTREFFRETWDTVGSDGISAIKEFFVSSELLKQLNSTALILIPKTLGAERIGGFRPISFCNAIYKVISKLIARRLQSLLPNMILNTQSSFVKGRLLVENVLLAKNWFKVLIGNGSPQEAC